ncbi:MAG: hypothetical protein JNK15_25120 [Planctomycetes bacterium]|nr:hypothetical protein [Planctomycetota bacterium]
MKTCSLLLVLGIANLATAQVQFSVVRNTPGLLTAGAGTAVQTLALPVAAVAGTDSRAVNAAGGYAYHHWSVAGLANPADGVRLVAATTGTASVASGTYRVDISQPTAGYVAFRLSSSTNNTPGAATLVSIDVGADGIAEVDNANPVRVIGLQVGPVPTPVLIRVDASATGTAQGWVDAWLQIVPPLQTVATKVHTSCQAGSFFATLSATNDVLGLWHSTCQFGCHPSLLVAGFSAQSQLLQPDPFCSLLVPSPDVVLLAPLGSTQVTWVVPVPAAVRPFVLWAQAVQLQGSYLRTSDAWLVVGQP